MKDSMPGLLLATTWIALSCANTAVAQDSLDELFGDAETEPSAGYDSEPADPASGQASGESTEDADDQATADDPPKTYDVITLEEPAQQPARKPPRSGGTVLEEIVVTATCLLYTSDAADE